MSTRPRTHESENEALIRKETRAIPVSKAVEIAFKFPPTIGIIILGPPGIGKTELVIEWAQREAKSLRKEFVELNDARRKMTREEYRNLLLDIVRNPKKYYVLSIVPFGATMPDDLLGVPQIVSVKDGGEVLALFEESALKGSLAVLSVKDIHGVLLIDDALNANDNVRKSFLQAAFQERLVGGFDGVRLSPNVRLIATGNLTDESELSTPLQKPMVGRAWMVYTQPNPLKQWYNNMEAKYGDNWFKEIYAFLTRYEQYYSRPDLIEDEPPTGPVPRSWTKLAIALKSIEGTVHSLLGSKEGTDLLMKIVAGFVGIEASAQLVAFLKKPVISVEDAVRNPEEVEKITDDMDMVFRFAVQLATKIKTVLGEGDQEKLFDYLKVLSVLMDKTTKDIGIFTYDMLPSEERRNLKKILRKTLRLGDQEKKEVARKIYSDIISGIVADVLIDTSKKWV